MLPRTAGNKSRCPAYVECPRAAACIDNGVNDSTKSSVSLVSLASGFALPPLFDQRQPSAVCGHGPSFRLSPAHTRQEGDAITLTEGHIQVGRRIHDAVINNDDDMAPDLSGIGVINRLCKSRTARLQLAQQVLQCAAVSQFFLPSGTARLPGLQAIGQPRINIYPNLPHCMLLSCRPGFHLHLGP